MQRLLVILALTAVGVSSVHAQEGRKFTAIPADQVIDDSVVRRHSSAEVEISVLQAACGELLTFCLNGRAVAKLAGSQMVPLYLTPGRYRFGVVPSYNFGRGQGLQQMNADITREPRQFYRIFQSGGFTSSGGNAVYEVSSLKNAQWRDVR